MIECFRLEASSLDAGHKCWSRLADDTSQSKEGDRSLVLP